jgi:hypothetical protein
MLGLLAILCLPFEGTAQLFCTGATAFTTAPNPQQRASIPVSPFPQHQHFLFSSFSNCSCPGEHEMHFIVVLIVIFLMTNDAVYFHMCLLVIYVSSLEKCPFKFLPYFFFFLAVLGFDLRASHLLGRCYTA